MKEFCALSVSDLIVLSEYTFVQSMIAAVIFWAAPVSQWYCFPCVTVEVSNDLGFVSICQSLSPSNVWAWSVRHVWTEGRLEVKWDLWLIRPVSTECFSWSSVAVWYMAMGLVRLRVTGVELEVINRWSPISPFCFLKEKKTICEKMVILSLLTNHV